MEQELVTWLKKTLPAHRLLKLGIGDDAALLGRLCGAAAVQAVPVGNSSRPVRGDLVVTVDTLTDQVDFRLEDIEPRWAGRKAVCANLSDLAAMAACPTAIVVSLVLPHEGALQLAKQLYEGIIPLAHEFDFAIAGGDINSWQGPLAITVTALGEVTEQGPLTRSGGRPGDALLVTGELGGSILERHLKFTPRVREALLLNERYNVHAGIDVSDGLALDVSRLASASDCGAELFVEAIPVSADARELARHSTASRTALDHALQDGEDFELVLATDEPTARRMLDDQPLDVPITKIGRLTEQQGLWQIDAHAKREVLMPRGFLHS